MVLNITQEQRDVSTRLRSILWSRCFILTPFGKHLDNVCFTLQKPHERHNFASRLSDFEQHGSKIVFTRQKHRVLNCISLVFDGMNHRSESISNVIDQSVTQPISTHIHVILQLSHSSSHTSRMRNRGKVESKDTVAENNDIHIDWLKEILTLAVCFKCVETNEIIVLEQLHLLTSFLHTDIFCRQRMDSKSLGQHLHFVIRWTNTINPPGSIFMLKQRLELSARRDQRRNVWCMDRLFNFRREETKSVRRNRLFSTECSFKGDSIGFAITAVSDTAIVMFLSWLTFELGGSSIPPEKESSRGFMKDLTCSPKDRDRARERRRSWIGGIGDEILIAKLSSSSSSSTATILSLSSLESNSWSGFLETRALASEESKIPALDTLAASVCKRESVLTGSVIFWFLWSFKRESSLMLECTDASSWVEFTEITGERDLEDPRSDILGGWSAVGIRLRRLFFDHKVDKIFTNGVDLLSSFAKYLGDLVGILWLDNGHHTNTQVQSLENVGDWHSAGLSKPFEDLGHLPLVHIQNSAQSVWQGSWDVFNQSTTGDVGQSENQSLFGSRVGVFVVRGVDDLSDQRESVGMNTVRPNTKKNVTGLHFVNLWQNILLDHSSNSSSVGVVMTWSVHSWHLTGLSSNKCTARQFATIGNSFHECSSNLDVKVCSCKVVQEHQWLSSLNNQIVDIHGNQVNSNGVVNVHNLGHPQLSSNTIGGSNKQSIVDVSVSRLLEVEKTSESSNLGVCSRSLGRSDALFDLLNELVTGIDRNSRVLICDGNLALRSILSERTVCDVCTVVLVLEGHVINTNVCLLDSIFQTVGHSSSSNDTTTSGHNLAVNKFGSSVENERVCRQRLFDGNLVTFSISVWVTTSRHHHSSAELVVVDLAVDTVQTVFHGSQHDLQKIRLQQWQHGLGLWVSETDVVLENLWLSSRSDHYSHKQTSNHWIAVFSHTVDGWLQDSFSDLLQQSRSSNWSRRKEYPSLKHKMESSSPSRNSSMTTSSPAEPNFLSTMISLMASWASFLLAGIKTPFPAAVPEALITKFFSTRSKDRNACLLKPGGNSINQRLFRTRDNKTNIVLQGKLHQLVKVGWRRANSHTGHVLKLGKSTITWSNKDFFHQRRLGQFPHKSVFTATIPHNKNVGFFHFPNV
ncbi:hypothetical protein OGAPHI_006942 [Ogataea philodendri]|uniref:Uncharacterized protein n=1 Tax=Ogataea philodendri TaxID=1378263 RepID=A0A9P8NW83_9ASCO|nr:uncharacterized protein OGAPHI_006942 [Ogataea philodendri]KAH3660356.1 hypothetical protein OGAPHI_006942 [Ogataea philodendri]